MGTGRVGDALSRGSIEGEDRFIYQETKGGEDFFSIPKTWYSVNFERSLIKKDM